MSKTKLIAVFIILLLATACSPLQRIGQGDNSTRLQRLEEAEKFENLNGFKAEEGRFYFSGIMEGKLGFFSINLSTHEVEKEDWDIGEYDLYVPLKKQESIIVNFDGELIHRKENKDKRIAVDISGEYSPNVILSPDRRLLLYTTGSRQGATLYRYDIDNEEVKKIKDSITEEAFYTFHYTTLWSNKSGYFIHNNEEIYDDKGEGFAVIKATSAKWSPDDKYIAYIQMPQDIEEQRIQIGDWKSYIGNEFKLYNLKDRTDEVLFKNSEGYIDPVDSIQWSKDSTRVAISEGKIIKSVEGELEEMQYERVMVYGLKDSKSHTVNDMKYNHYEFIFNTLVYGNNFGIREAMEIVSIDREERKSFQNPVMLNSKELFVITHKDKGYFVNGRDLMHINKDGKASVLISLPWKIDEMYIDYETEQLIIINENMELYLVKL